MNEFLKYNLSWCGGGKPSQKITLSVMLCLYVFSRFSHVGLFVIPWTAACQALLSMRFSRQEYWSRLPCPSPEDLPNPGIKPTSPASPSLAGRFFTTSANREAHYVQKAQSQIKINNT